jgi:hypothetical protein
MTFFEKDTTRAIDAIDKANWIAFAPFVFQAARSLKNLGILNTVEAAKDAGLPAEEIEAQTGVSHYGVRVLCEAGLAIGLLISKDEKYFLTKTAHFFMHNPFTVANADFASDVCYNGLFRLEDSIKTGKPEGLKVFGEWNTIYEALSQLPPKVQESWFGFDHYYSDVSFAECLPLVFEENPESLLDIGGNTGKFALQCLGYNDRVRVSIADLSGQLEMAKANAAATPHATRLSYIETNLLDASQTLPRGFDAIWLSQFLDCFSESEIVSILTRCADAMDEHTNVFILEPFWDRQRFATSAFCLMMTSLYFTSMANGNSQMYRSDLFFSLIEKAGLRIEKITDNIGVGHTLLKCRKNT